MSIVLIGFKGCGKTSLGRMLAHNFVDLDDLIQQQYLGTHGEVLTCAEIYRHHGEKYFREIETNVIQHPLLHKTEVIACGGGSVMYSDNVSYLKHYGQLIYLHASCATLLARLTSKPAFLESAHDFEQAFCELYNSREIIYQSIADRIIYTDNKSLIELTDEILHGK